MHGAKTKLEQIIQEEYNKFLKEQESTDTKEIKKISESQLQKLIQEKLTKIEHQKRKDINAMKSHGEIDQKTWRAARRALSNKGIEGANLALSTVRRPGVEPALRIHRRTPVTGQQVGGTAELGPPHRPRDPYSLGYSVQAEPEDWEDWLSPQDEYEDWLGYSPEGEACEEHHSAEFCRAGEFGKGIHFSYRNLGRPAQPDFAEDTGDEDLLPWIRPTPVHSWSPGRRRWKQAIQQRASKVPVGTAIKLPDPKAHGYAYTKDQIDADINAMLYPMHSSQDPKTGRFIGGRRLVHPALGNYPHRMVNDPDYRAPHRGSYYRPGPNFPAGNVPLWQWKLAAAASTRLGRDPVEYIPGLTPEETAAYHELNPETGLPLHATPGVGRGKRYHTGANLTQEGPREIPIYDSAGNVKKDRYGRPVMTAVPSEYWGTFPNRMAIMAGWWPRGKAGQYWKEYFKKRQRAAAIEAAARESAPLRPRSPLTVPRSTRGPKQIYRGRKAPGRKVQVPPIRESLQRIIEEELKVIEDA